MDKNNEQNNRFDRKLQVIVSGLVKSLGLKMDGDTILVVDKNKKLRKFYINIKTGEFRENAIR